MTTLDSESPTIVESFSRALPKWSSARVGYERHSNHTASTIHTDAPLTLYWHPSQEFEIAANKAIESKRVKQSILHQLQVARPLHEIRLETEGDVVFGSALYIVRPCLEILHQLYPGKWYIYSERSEGLDFDRHSFSSSHQRKMEKTGKRKQVDLPTKSSTVRYDLIIKTVPRGNEESQTIAVIEYKKRGLIRYAGFEDAMLPSDAIPADFDKKKKAAAKANSETCLAYNGAIFTSQARKYATQASCSHVAILNWDHLLLYNFPLYDDKNDVSATKMKTMLTWVTECETRKQGDIEVGYIRKTLLGWLLKAFEAHMD